MPDATTGCGNCNKYKIASAALFTRWWPGMPLRAHHAAEGPRRCHWRRDVRQIGSHRDTSTRQNSRAGTRNEWPRPIRYCATRRIPPQADRETMLRNLARLVHWPAPPGGDNSSRTCLQRRSGSISPAFAVFNYFRHDEFGHRLAGFAVEFKSLAHLLKRQPHGFYVLWADCVLREAVRDGTRPAPERFRSVSSTRRTKMLFLRRLMMNYGIYRRYPLGWLPALRNAWRTAQP
jgi:hypothetical protein